ncbi:hypothetical protein [Halanaerobaculum tunisiense]
MSLDSNLLLKVAQGDVKAKLNQELLLQLAQEKDLDSKTELAAEVELSRMHLYRLLRGNNVGLDAMKKISEIFPQHSDELFFLQDCNKKDTKRLT